MKIYSEWSDEVKELALVVQKLEQEVKDLRFFINEYINVKEEKRWVNQQLGF